MGSAKGVSDAGPLLSLKRRRHLENKSAEEFTAKDHHLSAEWVIQRYLPVGEEPTPEQWSEVSGDIQQKIDINLNKAAAGELLKTEYMQPARYTPHQGRDFLSDIVPFLKGLIGYKSSFKGLARPRNLGIAL